MNIFILQKNKPLVLEFVLLPKMCIDLHPQKSVSVGSSFERSTVKWG